MHEINFLYSETTHECVHANSRISKQIKQCISFNLKLEMWADAQRDGRPAKYRWRTLFNAAVWLMTTTRVLWSDAAKMRDPLKLPGVSQTNETISAASGPKFTIL